MAEFTEEEYYAGLGGLQKWREQEISAKLRRLVSGAEVLDETSSMDDIDRAMRICAIVTPPGQLEDMLDVIELVPAPLRLGALEKLYNFCDSLVRQTRFSEPPEFVRRDIRAEGPRAGGIERGRQRQKKADDLWKKDALEFWNAITAKDPSLTAAVLAESLQERWNCTGKKHPVGWDQIIKVISESRKKGLLPKPSKV